MHFRFVTPSNDLPISLEAKSKRFISNFLNTFAIFLILIDYNLTCYKFQQTKCSAFSLNILTEVSQMNSLVETTLDNTHFYCSPVTSLI